MRARRYSRVDWATALQNVSARALNRLTPTAAVVSPSESHWRARAVPAPVAWRATEFVPVHVHRGDKAHLGGFTKLDLEGVSPGVWRSVRSACTPRRLLPPRGRDP